MNSKNLPEVRQARELSKAKPILRNDAPRIVTGTRMVPMDKVVTPIPDMKYTQIGDLAKSAPPQAQPVTPPAPAK